MAGRSQIPPGQRFDESSSSTARFGSLDPEIQRILLNVAALIDSIAFGTVQIVLQNGQVIQLQTSEKIRLR